MARPTTPVGRVSFPAVYKPRPNGLNPSAEPKYEITLLFDKDDPLTDLRQAAKDAVQKKWGDFPPKGLRSPFKDGDETDKDGYEGMTFVQFKSVEKPDVRGPQLQHLTAEKGDFYAGCYAKVSYSCYAYDANGNRGVAFGLGNVQKIRDGDPFGAMRTTGDDDFEAVEAVAAGIDESDLF